MSKKHLAIIDPQVSFCDPDGSLFVPGSVEDMQRMTKFIKKMGKELDQIHVTIDSHYLIDVAHPGMWKNSDGEQPAPFTVISSKDLIEGKWFPVFPKLRQRFIDYTTELESSGKYFLLIWPPHCLIGSRGQSVTNELFETLVEWQNIRHNNVNFVTKGSNPYVEHFSPIKAQVIDPNDPSTQIDTSKGSMLQLLQDNADIIYVGGEALSHCVKECLLDVVEIFGTEEHIKKIHILRDTTSPVPMSPGTPDFPAISEQFLKDMEAKGVKIIKTTDF